MGRMFHIFLVALSLFIFVCISTAADTCSSQSDVFKNDCAHGVSVDSSSCANNLNCCWATSNTPGVPWCFHPSVETGYVLSNVKSTSYGIILYLD